LSKLNLDDIKEVVKEAYDKEGSPGRPSRKPAGTFKALMVKRLKQVSSERELCRRPWKARVILFIETDVKIIGIFGYILFCGVFSFCV